MFEIKNILVLKFFVALFTQHANAGVDVEIAILK